MDSKKYYDFSELLSRNAVYNVVVGPRGNGKSYGAKMHATRKALKKGEEFIYLRRHKEDLRMSRNTFFNDIAHNFDGVAFRVNGAVYEFTRNPEDKKPKWHTAGYSQSLSVAQQAKSVSYPKVHTILYDEFINEDGYTRYLPGEVEVFNNYYLTVDRYQDRVRVFMLANAVRIDNPYFAAWNIIPAADKIITRSGGFIAVHFPMSDEFIQAAKRSRFGRFISNTDYAKYAMSAEFRDNHGALVQRKDGAATYVYTLKFLKGEGHVWWYPEERKWFMTRKGIKIPQYITLDPQLVDEKTTLVAWGSEIIRTLRNAFASGLLYFDSPQSRNLFMEVYKR